MISVKLKMVYLHPHAKSTMVDKKNNYRLQWIFAIVGKDISTNILQFSKVFTVPWVSMQSNPLDYSVPHEESRKMFLFIVHFASFLQNQLSYGHVLCTTMIPYLPWFHRVLWLLVMWWSRDTRSPYIPPCSRQLLVEFLHNRWELRPDNAAFKPLPRVPSVTCA